MKVGLSGGTPVAVADVQDFPLGIAVNSTAVYWTNNANGSNNGAVMTVGTVIATNQHDPGFIAVDANTAYWTNGDGTIKKVAPPVGTPVTLGIRNVPSIPHRGGRQRSILVERRQGIGNPRRRNHEGREVNACESWKHLAEVPCLAAGTNRVSVVTRRCWT